MKAYEIFEKIDNVVSSLYGKAMDYISNNLIYLQEQDQFSAVAGANGLELKLDLDVISQTMMFAKGDKKTGKGGGRLHQARDTVEIPKGGRIIHVKKSAKPKGETLVSYVMRMAGVNNKQASRAIKNCQ
jgi:hypothetical protein